jgi:hypothetical protein
VQMLIHFPAVLDVAEILCRRGAREGHEQRGDNQA